MIQSIMLYSSGIGEKKCWFTTRLGRVKNFYCFSSLNHTSTSVAPLKVSTYRIKETGTDFTA